MPVGFVRRAVVIFIVFESALALITLSKKEVSLSQRMMDALSYYWVAVPFEEEMDDHYPEIISRYLHESKTKGFINKAVLTLLKEEKNV